MSQSLSTSPIPAPRTANLARRPLRQRPLNNGLQEPISLATRRPLFRPANILFFAAMAAFGLYAQGRLPELDDFFDGVQAFGRAHNDAVVGAILRALPALLVFSAATVLASRCYFALRNRRQATPAPPAEQNAGTAASQDALQAALVPQAAVALPEGGLEEHAPAGAQITLTPIRFPAEPHPAGKPTLVPERTSAAEVSQQLSLGKAEPPAAESVEPTLSAPARAHRHISESVPTLPAMPRVRRRNTRPTLPPAVIATLKMEVAKRTPSR